MTPLTLSGALSANIRMTGKRPEHLAPKNESLGSRLAHDAFGEISFEEMALITLDAIGDAVLVVNTNGKLIYLNKVAEKMTGWSSAEALGRFVEQVFFIFDGTTRERAPNPAQRAMDENRIVELAVGSVLIRRDGVATAIEDSAAPILDRQGKSAGAVIVFHDARQSGSAIEEMSYHAQHDFLTGLPNRMLLKERLNHSIGMAKRHNKRIAVLFLDMDGFKQINDTHGHAFGDHVLQHVSEGLKGCIRTTDIVSRHGGDEFVILLSEIEEKQDANQIAEKVLATFTPPQVVEGIELMVRLSIGIAVYPENGTDAESLMDSADIEMYTVKESSYCKSKG